MLTSSRIGRKRAGISKSVLRMHDHFISAPPPIPLHFQRHFPPVQFILVNNVYFSATVPRRRNCRIAGAWSESPRRRNLRCRDETDPLHGRETAHLIHHPLPLPLPAHPTAQDFYICIPVRASSLSSLCAGTCSTTCRHAFQDTIADVIIIRTLPQKSTWAQQPTSMLRSHVQRCHP